MPIRSSSMGGTPFGNSANRPSSPQVGQTYYNGELGYLEIYTSAGWIPASGGNDFNLNITGPYTTVTFTQSYGAGSYSVTSGSNDITLDIYAFAADGSEAGYTNTKSFTATKRFNKMVVIGGTNGDVLGFSYKTTYATSATTSEIASGPFITSISPSFMANQNDTITITGGNFATNVSVTFTGTGYSSTPAKNIVRSSSSSLIVTRPDNFPISGSPYTVTVLNPGVSSPTGSNSHILSNSVTSGTSPVWNTAATLPTFTRNVSYSTTVSATDPDSGGSITYSVISSSLAAGLSFNTSTATISGTATQATTSSITIRATDAGGNYVDRTFTIPNATPTWTTTAGQLSDATQNVAYSYQLVATDDSGSDPTYSLISGTLPPGLSINSSGLINGSATAGNANASFTIRATDVNGGYVDRSFNIRVKISINFGAFFGGGTADAGNWGAASMGTVFVPAYSGTITRVRALNQNDGNLGAQGLYITTTSSTTNPNVNPLSVSAVSASRPTYAGTVPWSGGNKSGTVIDYQSISYPVTAGQAYVISLYTSSGAGYIQAFSPATLSQSGGSTNYHWATSSTTWTSTNRYDYIPAIGITYDAYA